MKPRTLQNATHSATHTATRATEESSEASPAATWPDTKKAVCYRCHKGIARSGATHLVSVWSVANRPERVTVCGACALPTYP